MYVLDADHYRIGYSESVIHRLTSWTNSSVVAWHESWISLYNAYALRLCRSFR